jgi:hypothetical protein
MGHREDCVINLKHQFVKYPHLRTLISKLNEINNMSFIYFDCVEEKHLLINDAIIEYTNKVINDEKNTNT